MWRAIKRYFLNLPRRYRRYYVNWHHHWVYIPRQKRQLASYTSGITKITDGTADTGSGLYCAFVLFPASGAVPENVKRAIEAMRANRINILICLNADITDGTLEWLTSNVHKVIFRNNIGFDFGAYKDCVKYARDSDLPIRHFMLLNDSVFFMHNGLEAFFDGMMGDYDAVSAFENWGDNAGNHFQSFAVAVSGSVFHSAPFQAFWNGYLPVSSRLWAIEEGEKKLSDAILKTAATSSVLYTCAALCESLKDVPEDVILPDIIVPMRYRDLLPAGEKRMFSVAKQYRDVIEIVQKSSPVHCGAWLFPRFLGTPIVKKDIVYRQRFHFWEVQALFSELMTEAEFAEFSTQLRAKGNWEKLDPATLTRYQLGIA